MKKVTDNTRLRLEAIRDRCRDLDEQLSRLYDDAAVLLQPADDDERDLFTDHVIDWATDPKDLYPTNELLRLTGHTL